MAWSSNSSESGEQTPPRSPSPTRFRARLCTFAEFLAARQQHGRQDEELLPPPPAVLPTPAGPCGHCGKLEDLARRIWSAAPHADDDGILYDISTPPEHRVTVSEAALADLVAFEGNSCFTCVSRIYHKTTWVEDDSDDMPLHHAARCRNHTMVFHFLCLLGDEYGLLGATMVVRKLNTSGETTLHEAIRLGNWRTARLLMWVDPELARYPKAGQGTSPMYLAVLLRRKHIAEMLHGESRGNQLSYSGPDGQNALHAAVLHAYGTVRYISPDLS